MPLDEGLSATGGMRQSKGDSEMTPAVDSERSNTSTSTVGEDGTDRSQILAVECEMAATTSGSEAAQRSNTSASTVDEDGNDRSPILAMEMQDGDDNFRVRSGAHFHRRPSRVGKAPSNACADHTFFFKGSGSSRGMCTLRNTRGGLE